MPDFHSVALKPPLSGALAGLGRAATGLVAAATGAAGLWLAAHHPLSPLLALSGLALWMALLAWRPALWVWLLPAAVPLASLSPWSGWIAIDEFDLLVLGALAAGYGRWALDFGRERLTLASGGAARWALWLCALLAATSGLGLYRALSDSGLQFGWFQGYGDPLNALRACKAPVFALALWPLLRRQLRAAPAATPRHLALGLLAGLAIVVLAVLYERAAYPGLWDFSAPYRTTALFWEMHVGGAAIDAYLVLSMPFVAWALWSARSPGAWLAAALLALLAVYACLTTFARGVYLAVAAPLVVLGLVLLARRIGVHARAVLGRVLAIGAAVLLGAALLFGALDLYGMPGVVALSLGLLLALAVLRRRLPGWRDAAALTLALLLLLEVVAVFGTGNFMLSRLVASDRDLNSRVVHWRNGIGLVHGPAEWAWGLGVGRLPAHYSRFVAGGEFAGAAQSIDTTPGGGALHLSGPKARADLGGLLRLSQRVPLLDGARYRVAFDARPTAPTLVEFSVCEVHLLYERQCQRARLWLRPDATSWQHRELSLRGGALHRGFWYAPRRAAFSVSVLNAGGELDLDDLRLLGPTGQSLLHNGRFDDGLAHWLPVARFYFLPWHIDNLYLEWLIERGGVGLLLFAALIGGALWNLVRGPGRKHSLAPFLAASLCGMLVLGLLSSVMDSPRVAFLFVVLIVLAWSLDAEAAPR